MDLILQNLRKSYDGRVVLGGLSHVFPHGVLTCVTGRLNGHSAEVFRLNPSHLTRLLSLPKI